MFDKPTEGGFLPQGKKIWIFESKTWTILPFFSISILKSFRLCYYQLYTILKICKILLVFYGFILFPFAILHGRWMFGPHAIISSGIVDHLALKGGKPALPVNVPYIW